MLAAEAADHGYTVDESTVDVEQARILTVANLDPTELNAVLARFGLTPAGWRAELARQ